jgi:signal transduction histidine kinase
MARAANSDGVKSHEKTLLTFEVMPPWWRTRIAYSIYVLLIIAGVFAVDRFQRRRLIRKERERARQRELEQARQLEKAHVALKESMDQLTRTQNQLIHSEKMASLGQLTAGIAHEIKNPLNFIKNFAEVSVEVADELRLAQEEGLEIDDLLDDLKQNASSIANHSKRADEIIFAMMQHAGSTTGQREPADLNKLLDDYINLAYHGKRAQHSGFVCEIERNFDPLLGKVPVAQQELGRVFLNLLGNAFDAVQDRESARVAVCTRRNGAFAEIRISDNGHGIPSEIKDSVFEPFFTTKPAGSGTGLGLSISYDTITMGHSGRLSVESEEGEGAMFLVELPVDTV